MRNRCSVVCTVVLALVWGLNAAPTRATTSIDLSGTYVSDVSFLDCTLTFTQTGSTLTITGPCGLGAPTPTYSFELSGTVDQATGHFSASGVFHGLCETPGSVTLIGTGDGTQFSGTSTCDSLSTPITGTKCNNGVLDANEDCEDGNTEAGDCCSPTCRHDAAGAACASDSNACTRDACDGAGLCVREADPNAIGAPCTPDSNQCTDEVCNAAGVCVQSNNSKPCDDYNPCTGRDTCALGQCVSGPILPECDGPLDVTGDWEVTSNAGMFAASPFRRFVQKGAVMESTDLESGLSYAVGGVNPAIRLLQAVTLVRVFYTVCGEAINATVSADGETFSGRSTTYCGLDGTFGPYEVSGRRCDPVRGCGCDVDVACVTPDRGTRLAAVMRGDKLLTRVRWNHSDLPPTLDDPMGLDVYRVCMRTAGGWFAETALSGNNNWSRTRTGFRYVDVDGPFRRLWLQETESQAAVSALLIPLAPPSLPLRTPVTLRLIRFGPDPACFETTFDEPIVNTAQRFHARDGQ